MQLDIFEHSRDVMLRNDVVDALRARDADEASSAIVRLRKEYGADPMLHAFGALCDALRFPMAGPLSRNVATELLEAIEGRVASAAERVFDRAAGSWLSPLWRQFAAAIAAFPFDPANERMHAVPLLIRGGGFAEAIAHIERIASWRRQPAPLSWRVEATCRLSGFDAAWPLFAELSWMAPDRAERLAVQLQNVELTRLVDGFGAEFEGDDEPGEFAWFPAWALVAEPCLAESFRVAQEGAYTAAERCARLVWRLLALERRGRHDEVIDARRRLRDASRALFDRYMRSR